MCKIVRVLVACLAVLSTSQATAGPLEQAKRIHDRLAGVPASAEVLQQMTDIIVSGGGTEAENAELAADVAMSNADFYRTTLKNFATPWTNRDADVFAPLNDYTATVIGLVRDEVDFREVLTGNVIYVGDASAGVPAYSANNNLHYEALETEALDIGAVLEPRSQSSLTGIPDSAAAGVLTTRAAARAFFIAGTNRAMFRFTLINHLCTDLEQVADITRTPDRIRQDVTRAPGGDSRLFRNNCVGCHSGMDPMAQAFAYYNYEFDSNADPTGLSGQLRYNDASDINPETGTRVVTKYHINTGNFPFGFVTQSDRWDNYWRSGRNRNLGWDPSLPGSGEGAKSLGQELSRSEAFATCQVEKVFKQVCLRKPNATGDASQLDAMLADFKSSGYNLKRPFAKAAAYCRGES